jgi:hypothetical protein
MEYTNFKIGDRVASGIGADYDEGKIISIDTDGTATVAWDSGVRTPAILAELARIEERN